MIDELKRLLDDLETRLDAWQQRTTHELHARALRFEPVERLPILFQYPAPADGPFKPFPHREAFNDPRKMLFNELVHAFETSICHHHRVGDDLPFTIRANCGTIVIASLFGGRWEQHNDDPPWARPYESLDAIRAVFDIDPLDFTRGICPRIIDTYRYYAEALAGCPNVRRCVSTVLPDLQGPFDNAELLRGSEIYIDLIEQPDLVRRLLEHMVRAQVGFARFLEDLIHEQYDGFCHQHATALPGHILIRNDTPINISPAMYREHVAEHDEAVLSRMGGGGIHFCGKGDHLVPEILKLPSLTAIDLGQPLMNDLDRVYARCAERRIPIVRLRVSEEEILAGRVRQRFPTGVSLVHAVASIERAREMTAGPIAPTNPGSNENPSGGG
ncbi:MAG TPA: hypothetical protein VLM89_15085 [Phycisphaerae bacterium]|nr:hypothetical protein [Phycisphaerae bacterium]